MRALEADVQTMLTTRATYPGTVGPLTQGISNPPTQNQVQAIQDKLNELIEALQQAT